MRGERHGWAVVLGGEAGELARRKGSDGVVGRALAAAEQACGETAAEETGEQAESEAPEAVERGGGQGGADREQTILIFGGCVVGQRAPGEESSFRDGSTKEQKVGGGGGSRGAALHHGEGAERQFFPMA